MLLLVPTALEADLLYQGEPPAPLEVIGFGLVEAALGAASAIARNPAAAGGVVLVGAAGTYHPERLPVGRAIVAGSVRCHGIGVGEGAGHRSAGELGWAGSDTVELGGGGGELLSVAAAAATVAEARARSDRYPSAVAEEMEGYAVALAARRAAVPATIVRGISNVAGERHGWHLDVALAAARAELQELLP
ncbi:MAG TPA: hypothetical protein VMU66_06625 [Gaiellales bacterium]|nr:hypothetical protein [Gaiellales bacterium]